MVLNTLCITFIIYLTNTHVIYNIGIYLSLLLFIHVKMPSNQSFEIRIMYKITIILIIYESNYHIWKDSNCSYTVYMMFY